MLEDEVGVGVFAWVLSGGAYLGEDVVGVGEVEVAAEGEVACAPVAAAEEGVDVGESGASGGAVSEVPHVEFAGEGEGGGGVGGVVELLWGDVAVVAVDGVEDFGDGVGAGGALAEHVFFAGLGAELDAGEAGSVLSAVVLLLHEEVELVEGVHPGAVLVVVILQGLEEADHGYAAFVLQCFHFVVIFF